MIKPYRIMILSAGSLLGQNILDAFEGRRDRVHITGLDISCKNPRLFRCDQAYKSPRIDSPEFLDYVLELVQKEQPDIILPGRDHDVLALAELAAKSPELSDRILTGTAEAADMMNDKGKSYEFALKYNLPFAKSFVVEEDSVDEAFTWAIACGFPLLGKPTKGFGSLGIQIICNEEHLNNFLGRNKEGYMLQEILDFSDDRNDFIEKFQQDIMSGIPLFYHIPEAYQYAGQTVINRDGTIGEVFTSVNLMVIGRCEKSERYDDPALIELTKSYAKAMADAGWRGVFNFQCRKVGEAYIGHEMNGRMSGSTSARRWLGYDEVREVIKAHSGDDIGEDPLTVANGSGTVYRSLTDYFIADEDRKIFEAEGSWTKA